MTSCGDGTCTVRNSLPCGVSSIALLPLRMRFSSVAASGSRAMSAALTRRCSPLATSVTTTTARRAARSTLRVRSRSSFKSAHLFHVDPNGAAAGQPDIPRGLVGDAELQNFRLAAVDHVDRLGDHRAFHAAAGHAAEKIALIVDHEI